MLIVCNRLQPPFSSLCPNGLFSFCLPPLCPSPVRFPSGLDVWYLLHVQGQVSGQNSPLDHLQSGLVLVQGETAQDLVSLEREKQRERMNISVFDLMIYTAMSTYMKV